MKVSRNSTKIKWIVAFSLIAVLLVSMIFALVKLDKLETTKPINGNMFNYSVGILDENGEYKKDTSSIYLKSYYDVDGLDIDFVEESTITYKVAFYDDNKDFIEMTGSLAEDFDSSSIPTEAEYFRVCITPTNDAEVSLFEIGDYSNMLTIKVNK